MPTLDSGPEQLDNLLALMPYASVVVDQQGRITMANSLVENLLGYGPNELLGRPVETLVPERFRDQHLPSSRLRSGATPASHGRRPRAVWPAPGR